VTNLRAIRRLVELGLKGEGKIGIAAFLRGIDLIVIGTTFQNRALF